MLPNRPVVVHEDLYKSLNANESQDLLNLRQSVLDDWRPRNFTERLLVEQIAVAQWKLSRAELAESVCIHSLRYHTPFPGGPAKPLDPEDRTLASDLSRQDSKLQRIQAYQARLERSLHRAISQLLTLRKARRKRQRQKTERKNDTKPADKLGNLQHQAAESVAPQVSEPSTVASANAQIEEKNIQPAPTTTDPQVGVNPSQTDACKMTLMTQMSLSRRSFLQYVGYGTAASIGTTILGPLSRPVQADLPIGPGAWVSRTGVPTFTPVDYPIPLPTDAANLAPAVNRLGTYRVVDDLLLPKGYTYDVVASWGDKFKNVTFGTAADYTGLTPIPDRPNEYWMIVNHEYISARPWLQGCKAVHGESFVDEQGKIGSQSLTGLQIELIDDPEVEPELKQAISKLCHAAMTDLGVTVLHVKCRDDHAIEVVKDSDLHFRIHGFGTQNMDPAAMHFTGPAANILGKPRGTFSNCSGATTPWGTFLSCEENFQDQVREFITPAGTALPEDRKLFSGMGDEHPTKLPFELEGLGTGITPPLDGRQYGWVAEIDPVSKSMHKHTWLGRFRHENVAIRAEAGKPLVAYMGDDRRGGHVWKFVSKENVTDPKSRDNAKLFETGTLYAAKFEPDFTGQWIALTPATPLVLPDPKTTAGGHVWLPYRPAGGHVAVGPGKASEMSVKRWVGTIEMFTGKPIARTKLGDLCDPSLDEAGKQAVILTDAYVFANAAGATPTARPEDVEVHPVDQSVYIAFTDSTGSADGSPDATIFPDSAGENSRQYGAIYRIAEIGNQPDAEAFTWGRFVASGEVCEQGSGFACADNLVFDPQANLWMVCDISTPRHNTAVTRDLADKTNPGGSGFVGVFGNNAIFCIPTTGDFAGKPFCFGIGPMECEVTGPTFTDDGQTLLVAIQHPGELHGTRQMPGVDQPADVVRTMVLADVDGKTFEQKRTVPLGSNFPGNKPGSVPKACVVSIRRA